MTYYTDLPHSESETLFIELQKTDKNDPDYKIIEEEYYEALERENEERYGLNYCSMVKKLMR